MKNASAAFNVPKSMNLKDVSTINLVLDLKQTPEDLKKLLRGEGEKESVTIKVSDRMQAQLISKDFDIMAIRPEIQVITINDMTMWEWEIRPLTHGNKILYLTLNALFEVNGTETPKAIKSFSKKIDIEVTWYQHATIFWKKYWQWLVTTILIPVLMIIWNKYKKNLG
jgi:hypothetical protein